MEYNDIIRVVSKAQQQTIINRSKYIVDKQYLIGSYLNKFDWYLFDKTFIDIRQQEQVSQLLLKRIKKRIKAHTTIKDVSDDFLDSISTIDGFYASKKFSADSGLTFSVGTNTESSLLIIKKALCFEKLNSFEEFKQFIIKLIDFFEPKWIEVSDYIFYNDLVKIESDEYRLGWMTYFSKDIRLPLIPADIKVEELPNGGRLLITADEIFSIENSEHIRKAKLLVDLFRKNGIKAC